MSDEVDRPTVIGFFSPKILIPGWLLEKLTAAELEQIVLHEAGHLGRADDWMNLLQKIALVIFPLNPALAWVERRLCFERELAVDERVLQAFAGKPGAAKAYAECLTTLAEYRLGRRGLRWRWVRWGASPNWDGASDGFCGAGNGCVRCTPSWCWAERCWGCWRRQPGLNTARRWWVSRQRTLRRWLRPAGTRLPIVIPLHSAERMS